jgi:hypothetical protein
VPVEIRGPALVAVPVVQTQERRELPQRSALVAVVVVSTRLEPRMAVVVPVAMIGIMAAAVVVVALLRVLPEMADFPVVAGLVPVRHSGRAVLRLSSSSIRVRMPMKFISEMVPVPRSLHCRLIPVPIQEWHFRLGMLAHLLRLGDRVARVQVDQLPYPVVVAVRVATRSKTDFPLRAVSASQWVMEPQARLAAF